MIDSRHELISFYIVFTLLLVANLYSQQDSEVTLLFLFISIPFFLAIAFTVSNPMLCLVFEY